MAICFDGCCLHALGWMVGHVATNKEEESRLSNNKVILVCLFSWQQIASTIQSLLGF